MNTFEMVAIALVGVGFVAFASFAIYAVLPHTAQALAAKHGRYTGLGAAGPLVNETAGRRVAVASLLGHSA